MSILLFCLSLFVKFQTNSLGSFLRYPRPSHPSLNQCLTYLAFAAIVTAVAAWSIWGPSDIFPAEPDPTGGMFAFRYFHIHVL